MSDDTPEIIFETHLPASLRMKQIYFVGKIEKHCWRSSIVGFDRLTGESNFMLNRYSYVGPFFESCDHGCAHGPASHGAAAGRYSDCGAGSLSPRERVADRARQGIRSADTVFVWIGPDFCSAFGSLIEIGFAHAQGKRVILCVHPDMTTEKELWFCRQFATGVIVAPTAKDGFKTLAEKQYEHRARFPLTLMNNPDFEVEAFENHAEIAWVDGNRMCLGFKNAGSKAVEMVLRWSS